MSSSAWWTEAEASTALEQCGYICDIGQIGDRLARRLDRMVKRGQLGKYRGHFDTLHPAFGIGRPKSIWVTPAVAETLTGELGIDVRIGR